MDDDYNFDCREQLWTYLDESLSSPCESHAQIDDVLRTWLYCSAKHREPLLDSDPHASPDENIIVCCSTLIGSPLFRDNADYVRMQIIYSLLGEDDSDPLHVIASFLLLDGRNNEATFPRMITEGCFPKLVDLIGGLKQSDAGLHRLLLKLMYEMSRVERLRPADLMQIEDTFVSYLFELVEGGTEDVNDPHHYSAIKILLVLNEQYMVASTTVNSMSSSPLTNRVIKLLGMRGPLYRTFGENLILVLNRETETALQLLILKLLYLLFTTRATYEYFYTNDLYVLLDIVIRNLLDLPDERVSLRHTYLRVLYPLLAHTQLSQPPHHKKEEIMKLLAILRGSGSAHFAPADETTLRLVERVSKVTWLVPKEKPQEDETTPSPTEASPTVNKKFLGISLSDSQAASSVSIVDVVGVTEKPGVKTPSKTANAQAGKENDTASKPIRPKKVLPEVPKHRHGALLNPSLPATVVVTGPSPTKKMPPKVPPPRRKTKTRPVMASPDPAES